MANYEAKLSKEEFDTYLRKLSKEGHSLKSSEITSQIYVCSLVYYGGWKASLNALGLTQTPHAQRESKRKIDKSDVKPMLLSLLVEGCSKTDISKRNPSLYRFIRDYYGSIESYASKTGIDLSLYSIRVKNSGYFINTDRQNDRQAEAPRSLTEEATKKFIEYLLIASETTTVDAVTISHKYPGEFASIKKHYGGLHEAFSRLTNIYLLDKNVPKKWTAEFLINQIILGYDLNKPLNTDYITRYASSAEEFARRTFGSWRNAIIESGIPIEHIELENQKYARAGHKFEEILGDVLKDLGFEFQKYLHDRWNPDFVVGNHWIDAKLSQNTVFSSDTLENYEPHCEELTIIFLRGDKKFDKKLTDKTRMVSVYKLLKELPEVKQRYYRGEFLNLLSNELGSQSNTNQSA